MCVVKFRESIGNLVDGISIECGVMQGSPRTSQLDHCRSRSTMASLVAIVSRLQQFR